MNIVRLLAKDVNGASYSYARSRGAALKKDEDKDGSVTLTDYNSACVLSDDFPESFGVDKKRIEELFETGDDTLVYLDDKSKKFPNRQAVIAEISSDLLSFIHDRLKVFLRDKGIRHDIIDACIAMPNNDDLTLLVKRAEALSETLKSDDGANLIQGFKRANNILTQAEEKDGVSYELDPNPKFAENDAEKALFKALDEAAKVITPAMEAEDFASAMSAMAKLRGPIDAFFEDTKINTDNDIIRRNRMCLLHRIRTICGGVADLTKLES
jgi:glycyl-tRNA synthetase beta subunit